MTNINQSQAIGRHDTSLMSTKSATKNASLLAQNLDTEELEALAMCFDNIRQMRSQNENMTDNDDTALGDQFDEVLTMMISNLTESLKECHQTGDRNKAVIMGKRDMMQLLVEKTLEYFRLVDPQAEIVLTDLATQYESLIDNALNMVSDIEADISVTSNSKQGLGGVASQRQIREKDKEIKLLKQ